MLKAAFCSVWFYSIESLTNDFDPMAALVSRVHRRICAMSVSVGGLASWHHWDVLSSCCAFLTKRRKTKQAQTDILWGVFAVFVQSGPELSLLRPQDSLHEAEPTRQHKQRESDVSIPPSQHRV